MSRTKSTDTPIPDGLNLTILAAAVAACVGLLYTASHTNSTVLLVTAGVAFSYVNNTLFSLLHEATHGIAHSKAAWNRWVGRIAAAFYPTSYTLQRAFHLTHHRNNRTSSGSSRGYLKL